MSIVPDLSANGRYVVFSSAASSLVPGGNNGVAHIYLHDQQTHQTTRVDMAEDGALSDRGAVHGVITADGRYVAFRSAASNLVSGVAPGGASTVFVHDVLTGANSVVNMMAEGAPLRESPHGNIDISGNGRAVAFSAVDTRGRIGVFVFDRDTGTTTRVSVSSTNNLGDGDAWGPTLSHDGQLAAFVSNSSNLVDGDAPGWDVFVHDRQTRETTRVGVGALRAQVSADGRFVVFESTAVYVHDRLTGATVLASKTAGGAPVSAWNPSVSADGRVVVFGTNASLVPSDTNSAPDYYVYDRVFDVVRLLSVGSHPSAGTETASQTMAISADGRTVAFDSPQTDLVANDTNGVVDVFTRSLDIDGDGMIDDWEFAFGLDPLDAADADLDLDGDGLTARQESIAGSHPRGLATRYFAEGATGRFFRTTLAVGNASPVAAEVLLTFQRSDGVAISRGFDVPAYALETLDLASVPGLASAEFSTRIESNVPVTVERRVSWEGQGSHAETSVPRASATWYLAEGATFPGFDVFYLLQNPGPRTATVEVTYLFAGSRQPLVRRYVVSPESRRTLWLNHEDARLQNVEVAAVVCSLDDDVPIVVERAMYLSAPRRPFVAGHVAAGVPSPATTWYLAEGSTGSFFDAFLLIANPTSQDAEIDVRYLLPDGATVTRSHRVPAQRRYTIWVDLDHPRLASTAFSAIVTSTNDVPVVVERSMWWPGPTAATWRGAHVAAGVAFPSARWVLASEAAASASSPEPYLLIANVGSDASDVRLRLFLEDGSAVARDFRVPPGSRTTISVAAEFPEVGGQRFTTVVEGRGVTPARLVVERADYDKAGDRSWNDGTSLHGTPMAGVFFDEDAFRSAMGAAETTTFDGFVPGEECEDRCAIPLRVGEVDVLLTSTGAAVVSPVPTLFGPETPVLSTGVDDAANNVVITPPPGTRALGLRVAAPGGVSVTVVDGEGNATTEWYQMGAGFLGFESPSGIESLRMSSPHNPRLTPLVSIAAIVFSR